MINAKHIFVRMGVIKAGHVLMVSMSEKWTKSSIADFAWSVHEVVCIRMYPFIQGPSLLT